MRRAALLAAAGLTVTIVLAGCFDGTVRNPPGEGAGKQRGSGAQGGGKAGGTANGGKPGAGENKGGGGGGSDDGISFAAVGDTAMGITPTLPPEPTTYFDPIDAELKGDVVFGNLEGTLTDVSEDVKCGPDSDECFAFRAPPEYAEYLRAAGFTAMSLANNHSYDFGEAGQGETIAALHRAGIEPVGVPGRIAFIKVGGRKVALLGFAPYGYAPSLTDLDAARALIRSARKRADIVVVANHAGGEGADALHVTGETEIYLGEDRGNAEEFAQMAVEAGADLVLGSGPHVLRGMEIYRGRLIAYSLGNFSGFHNFGLEGVLSETVVLHATLAPDGAFRSGRLASVRMVEAGQPVPDPEGAGAALVAELSKEDFGRNGVEVSSGGDLRR
ncbi:MAG: CapA family protein [Thermoleophilia bacterium]|nr:CapA family protein [Thermoleophilia bacterium]